MILQLYKSNNPIVLALLPVVLVVLWLPGLLDPVAIDFLSPSPAFQVINDALPIVWSKILAMVLIVVTGIVLNGIVNNNEIFDRTTYLPALLYVLCMSVFPDMQVLSPITFSNLFWALAFWRLFRIFRQVPSKQEAFDASVFLLLGGLFYFPSIVMFPIVWIALAVLRPFVWREWLMPLLAASLVLIYWVVYILYADNPYLAEQYYNFHIGQYQLYLLEFHWSYYIAFGALAISVNLSGMQISRQLKSSSMRFRKITTFFMFIISFSIILLVLERLVLKNQVYSIVSAGPLSLLLTFYFYGAKRKLLSGALFYSILLVLIVNIYFF